MNFEYSKDITCIKCGEQDVKVVPALNGISYCTCKVCGAKFIVQSDGSDMLGKYVAARQRVFAALESGSVPSQAEARSELSALVRDYSVIADIDPIYYWYKLEIITDRFTDFSKIKEAEKEYGKIPASDCYFVTQDDVKRSKIYAEQYARYKGGKRKKLKAVIAAAVCGVCAVLVGVGIFVGVSTPVVKNAEAGVSVKLNNSSYGLFGKFSVASDFKTVESGDGEYALLDGFIKNETTKAEFYNICLLKGGFESAPKSEVTVSVKINGDLRRDRICVYAVNADGGYAEIESSVSVDNTVVFKTNRLGLFAVAEKPFSVIFDTDGGSEVKTQKLEWGKTASVPQAENTPVKTGYTFNGWYNGNSEYDFTSPVISDINLTAKWTANKYTVSYYDGGVLLHTQQVVYDENTVLRASEKKGYSVEWFCGEKAVKDGAWKIADDTRLDARWIPLEYTVTLNDGFTPSNEAEAAGSGSVTATFDSALSAVKVPKRTGYKLDGYYTQSGGAGVKYIGGDGKGTGAWGEDGDCTLYANWVIADEYAGYTFISSSSELYAVSKNTSGKYLLTRDIDLQGANWTPFNFSGIFDGGYHCIYNYKVTDGTINGHDKALGFIGILSGTVKNLQIGREGYMTSVNADTYQWNLHVGVVAGFSTGTVINCRSVNCSINVKTFAQGKEYYGQEFAVNVGGICGVQRGGSIQRCFVTDENLVSEAKTNYNKLNAMARVGGIAGYSSDNCSILNCYVAKGTLDASSNVIGDSIGNPGGAPFARTGGIVAEAVNTTISSTVINKNVSINCDIKWGTWVGNGGTKYRGSMFGVTSSTRPSNLIGINTSLQCSGTNSSYGGFATIGNDSFSELTAKNSAFNNGLWISDGGKIALKFYD